MIRQALSTLVAVALAVPAAAGAAAAAPTVVPSERDRLLQQLLDAEHAAGMPGVFAEVRDGNHRWTGAAGVADVQTGRPVRPRFEHRVGSITKTFVATALLQLVGEGRLRLDAPIGRHLPEVVPDEVGRQVTVRMLLNHTSGIGNYTNVLLGTTAGIVEAGQTTYTSRELVRMGLGMPSTNAPGAAWSYSNTNYVILGLLLERLTGRSYAAEVDRRILRPLGLRHTYFPGADPTLDGPHSGAYLPWTDGQLRDFRVYNSTWIGAAGELVSTTADLDRFFRALLTGRLLRPAELAQMQTTVLTNPEHPEYGSYGLGLIAAPTPCGTWWGHTGGVIGQATFSWHSADGSRQLSLAENMNFYALPGDPPTPIDLARSEFMSVALCGGEQSRQRGASPSPALTRQLGSTPAGVTAAAVPRAGRS